MRTYVHQPRTDYINVPDKSNSKYFNHTAFKGIIEDENIYTLDQYSLSDANNVYVDTYNHFVSRLPLVEDIQPINKDIIEIHKFGDINIYVTKGSTFKYDIISSHGSISCNLYNLCSIDHYIICFNDQGAKYIDTKSNIIWQDFDDNVYVPISKVTTGDSIKVNEKNQFTEQYIEQYIISNQLNTTLPKNENAEVEIKTSLETIKYNLENANDATDYRLYKTMNAEISETERLIVKGNVMVIVGEGYFKYSYTGNSWSTILFATPNDYYPTSVIVTEDGYSLIYLNTEGAYNYNLTSPNEGWTLIPYRLDAPEFLPHHNGIKLVGKGLNAEVFAIYDPRGQVLHYKLPNDDFVSKLYVEYTTSYWDDEPVYIDVSTYNAKPVIAISMPKGYDDSDYLTGSEIHIFDFGEIKYREIFEDKYYVKFKGRLNNIALGSYDVSGQVFNYLNESNSYEFDSIRVELENGHKTMNVYKNNEKIVAISDYYINHYYWLNFVFAVDEDSMTTLTNTLSDNIEQMKSVLYYVKFKGDLNNIALGSHNVSGQVVNYNNTSSSEFDSIRVELVGGNKNMNAYYNNELVASIGYVYEGQSTWRNFVFAVDEDSMTTLTNTLSDNIEQISFEKIITIDDATVGLYNLTKYTETSLNTIYTAYKYDLYKYTSNHNLYKNDDLLLENVLPTADGIHPVNSIKELSSAYIISIKDSLSSQLNSTYIFFNNTLYNLNKQIDSYKYVYTQYGDEYTKYMPDKIYTVNDKWFFVSGNKIYTNNFADEDLAILSYRYGANNKFTEVPTVSYSDTELYLAFDNSLKITNNIVDENSVDNILFNLPPINNQSFIDNITGMRNISTTEVAIYFIDSVQLCSKTSDENYVIRYDYYKTKLSIGIRLGDSLINTLEGQFTVFPTPRGLARMSYQAYMATTDQVISYISDKIKNLWNEFYADSTEIHIIQHDNILYLSNGTNTILLYDLLNDSWWRWTLPVETNTLISDQVDLRVLSNKLYIFKEQEQYYDLGNKTIDWLVMSQPVHFTAPTYTKNIKQLIFHFYDDIGNALDTNRILAQIQVYRKKLDQRTADQIAFSVDGLRTFVKRFNYWKINELQWALANSTDTASPKQLKLNSISIKYSINEEVR